MLNVPQDFENVLASIISVCTRDMKRIATAESCTSGLVAFLLTHTAGSSVVFKRGWVTYDAAAKMEEVAVQRATIDLYGVYSEAVAKEMAWGARRNAGANYGIGITGVAGPGPSEGVKAGNVWIAISHGNNFSVVHHEIKGSREEVRWGAAQSALVLLAEAIKIY